MMREVHDDVVALLAAASLRVYGAGDVPPEPTYPYVTVNVERRGMGGNVDRDRMSSRLATVGWRISTMHVSNHPSSVLWLDDKVEGVLRDVRLTIDGIATTPLHYESGSLVVTNTTVENLYATTAYWTCVSTALQPA